MSRSEVDLKKIIEEYKAMYGITLHDHIVVRYRSYKVHFSEWLISISDFISICFTERDQ